MAKHLSIILLLAFSLKGFTQIQNSKLKTIGISIPVIWNKSEGTYYALGRRINPEGKAVSYGLNIVYKRTLYKNLFGIAGIGYFRQKFGIQRPFDFTPPDSIKPVFYTKKYMYNTIQLTLGIGYQLPISNALALNGAISYNLYNSYRQKYAPVFFFEDYRQINHKSIALGSMINATVGGEIKLTKKVSAGIDLIIPVSTNWNNDEIFFRYNNADDTQQIGRTKSSYGAAIICNYHF
jgi:hypothetical protein